MEKVLWLFLNRHLVSCPKRTTLWPILSIAAGSSVGPGSVGGLGDSADRFHEGKRVSTMSALWLSSGRCVPSLRLVLNQFAFQPTQQRIVLQFHANSFWSFSGGVTNQSIPIVLPVHTADKERLEGCSAFALSYEGKRCAIIRTPEFYEHRKEERASRQFGTSNLGHPYVKVGAGVILMRRRYFHLFDEWLFCFSWKQSFARVWLNQEQHLCANVEEHFCFFFRWSLSPEIGCAAVTWRFWTESGGTMVSTSTDLHPMNWERSSRVSGWETRCSVVGGKARHCCVSVFVGNLFRQRKGPVHSGRTSYSRYLSRYWSPSFDVLQADSVFAFQLRNPVHNGHALLMQDTRRRLTERGYSKPVLLLHPLGNHSSNLPNDWFMFLQFPFVAVCFLWFCQIRPSPSPTYTQTRWSNSLFFRRLDKRRWCAASSPYWAAQGCYEWRHSWSRTHRYGHFPVSNDVCWSNRGMVSCYSFSSVCLRKNILCDHELRIVQAESGAALWSHVSFTVVVAVIVLEDPHPTRQDRVLFKPSHSSQQQFRKCSCFVYIMVWG